MEAKAKSNDKDKHNEEELEHGEADVPEHEDEDAEGGKLLEVGEEVEPGHSQDERPNRPTPALTGEEFEQKLFRLELTIFFLLKIE